MWEKALDYIIPFFVALITGTGGMLLHKKKVKKIYYDMEDLILNKKVSRQMGIVNGILNVLWSKMKEDYANMILKNYKIDIISNIKCDERKSFFNATFDTKVPLMDKYEIEFRRNGIEQWEDHDIEARVNRMFAFVIEEFEKNFHPNKEEIVKLVMDEFKEHEERYKKLFTDLYNSAKCVYDEEGSG